MPLIWDIILYGVMNGAIYALFSVGLSMAYGVGGVLNLAHGAFYMIGAYATYHVLVALNWPVASAMIIATLGVFLLALAIDLLLVRRVRGIELSVIILTFALAIFFEESVRLTWGAKFLPLPSFISGDILVFGTSVSLQRLFAFFLALFLIVVLRFFITKTKLGKAFRATAQDEEAAQLMGVNTRFICSMSYGIGAALAGVTGVVVGPIHMVYPSMGWGPLIKAFCIVVLGGLGSFTGTIIGSLILGFSESFTALAIGSELRDVVSLAIMILILILRPQGLFGKYVE